MTPEELRDLIPFVKKVTYLDNASVVPAPARVWAAMERYAAEYPLNYGVGEFPAAAEASALVDRARAKIAGFFNARSPEEIIFTKNTTEAINIVSRGGLWNEGDEIVLTALEHQSNLMPWMRLEKERGVALKFARADARGMIDPGSVERQLSPRTKLINVTYVSNIYGTITPVEEIGEIARRIGALYMVDAAQACGRIPIDVRKIGCDFMAICGRKGMMGPQGTGALYVCGELAPRLEPLNTGSRAGNVLDEKTVALNDAPYRFEAGVLNTAGVIGLGAAADILSEIGLEKVKRRVADLTQYMIDGLAALPMVELYGPGDARKLAGVISWNVKGIPCTEAARRLGREANVAVAAGAQGSPLAIRPRGVKGVVRSSVHYFNNREDIDALLNGLKTIARG